MYITEVASSKTHYSYSVRHVVHGLLAVHVTLRIGACRWKALTELHRLRRLARAEKDIREGAEHARRLAAEYPWVASERQFFGRPGGDYDWGARDTEAAFAELERAEETLGRLGKGLNKRVRRACRECL